MLRDDRRADSAAARYHLEEALAPDPQDEYARHLLGGFESESSQKAIGRQSGRVHAARAAPVAVDLSDRDLLEFFPSEESVRLPAVAPTTGASGPPRRENPPDLVGPRSDVARTAASSTRDRQSPARAAITLAVFALLGLIGFIVIRVVPSRIRVVPSRPEANQPRLLESVGTVAIGSVVSVPGRPPIEPQALVDAAPVIGSTQEQIFPPARPVVELPRRNVATASESTPAAVMPPATMPHGESPSSAPASSSPSPPSPTSTLLLPPAEPVNPLPAAVDPTLARPESPPPPARQPELVAGPPISAEASGAVIDRASIEDLINRYQNAFNNLNARAAKTLWPSVDERMLGKAFDQLKRQEVVLNACQISVTGRLAVSSCQGHASYVPKVGNKVERTETGRWTFKLRKGESGWLIDGIESR